MDITNWDWGNTFATVIVGLVVVFSVLLILVLVCSLMGVTFKKIDNNKNKKSKPDVNQNKTKEKKVTTSTPVQAVAAPVVENGISDDVVAAISGAIACMMGSDKKFAVKSIKRSRGTRSAWNTAGIIDNTRPF